MCRRIETSSSSSSCCFTSFFSSGGFCFRARSLNETSLELPPTRRGRVYHLQRSERTPFAVRRLSVPSISAHCVPLSPALNAPPLFPYFHSYLPPVNAPRTQNAGKINAKLSPLCIHPFYNYNNNNNNNLLPLLCGLLLHYFFNYIFI